MTGATCGPEMLTLSRTPAFTPFGEFMISLIHYAYIYITKLVLGLMTGLFTRISLTALPPTYCITLFDNTCIEKALALRSVPYEMK